MRLSIVTVNLNNLDGLKRTIDSVLSQTFTDYEWIVVDGGSTDGSKELIEQYSNHFAWWVSEPDTGIYNAMNKGIAHAEGDWIQFLNSGDWFYDNKILNIIFANSYDSDVLYGDIIIKKNNNKTIPIEYPDTFRFSYFLDHTLSHQASFYNKKIFENNKYDESFKISGDLAFSIKLLLNNKKFEHLKHYIIFFDGDGIGSQNSEDVFHEYYLITQNVIPHTLLEDLETIKKWEFIENRKTLRVLKKVFFQICKLIDVPLHKYELWRKCKYKNKD